MEKQKRVKIFITDEDISIFQEQLEKIKSYMNMKGPKFAALSCIVAYANCLEEGIDPREIDEAFEQSPEEPGQLQ